MDQSPTGEYIVIRRVVDNSKVDEVKMPIEEFRKLMDMTVEEAKAHTTSKKVMSAKVKMFLLKI